MQRPAPLFTPLRLTAGLLATTAIISSMAPAAEAYPTYRMQGTELVAAGQAPKPNERVRVAVVDFRTIGAPTTFGEAVAENLRNELVQQQKYTVVERSQIQQALKEQHFGQTGLVDAKQAITLGRLLGAKVIVVGSVTKIGSTYTINARFIDVETGEATDARSLKTRDVDDIASVVDELAAALSGKSTAASGRVQKTPTGKSKLLASGMSLLFPGAGQFYNGNIGWGIAQLVLNIAGFSVAAAGRTQGTTDTTMFGLGSLMMLSASGWSAFDGWFTTEE